MIVKKMNIIDDDINNSIYMCCIILKEESQIKTILKI